MDLHTSKQTRVPPPCFFSNAGEKEEREKLKKKQEKKQARQDHPPAPAAAAGSSGRSSKLVPALKATKMKRKAPRIKKNATIRGIRIRDAASKQKVRELLAEEAAQRTMDTDAAPPKKRGGVLKGKTATKQVAASVGKKAAPEGMALD